MGERGTYIPRELAAKVRSLASTYPVISVTGPRQSGKSTMLRHEFPAYDYVNLEDPDARAFADNDPRGFLAAHPGPAIFDEVQRVPSLFSYLQGEVDTDGTPGRFVLSGSQSFLLAERISQTLAGRVGVLNLLPLSRRELAGASMEPDVIEWIWRGGYPREYAAGIDPQDFFPSYRQTYVDRDIRGEEGVAKIAEFETFLTVCASRAGELLDMTSVARAVGVSVNTIKSWISILESSFVAFRLRPHHNNFEKRLVKSPKLYFWDTGLACDLLGIESPAELRAYRKYGNVFENAVVAEIGKRAYSVGRTPRWSFWRDSNGNEVDLLLERGIDVDVALEVKSTSTFSPDSAGGLTKFADDVARIGRERCVLAYNGTDRVSSGGIRFSPIDDLDHAIELARAGARGWG